MADSEKGLFFIMQKQVRYMRVALILSVFAMMLVVGYAFFSMAMRTDKVVLLDSTGHPQLLEHKDDQVFKSESLHFLRKVVEQTYTIDYGRIVNQPAWKDYLSNLQPFYKGEFFKTFIKGLSDSGFYQSVADGKLIVSPAVKGIRDITRQEDDKIIGIVDLETSTSSRDGTFTVSKKIYEVKLERGSRTVENPWGLYVYFLAERS